MHLSVSCADAVFFIDSRSSPFRALSVPPPPISIPPRSYSVSPRDARATSVPPLYNHPLSPLDILSEYEREPFQRALSPTPIKCGRWAPRSNEVAYDTDGNLLMMFLLTIPVNQFRHYFHWFFCLLKSLWIKFHVSKTGFTRTRSLCASLHHFVLQCSFFSRSFIKIPSKIALNLTTACHLYLVRNADLPWWFSNTQRLGQSPSATCFITTHFSHARSILVRFGWLRWLAPIPGRILFATIASRLILVTGQFYFQ